ncbi:MAG: hypothetical protein ACK4JE_05030, partial [Endomicrobiia bacterium]
MDIEKQIEEINQILVQGANAKDTQKIKQGIRNLKDIIKEISLSLPDLNQEENQEETLLAVLPYVEKISTILQNILSFIEKNDFSNENLNNLQELEKELQEILEELDTLLEIYEYETEEENEIDIEKEFE